MPSHALSLLRKTAQQSERLRWDNDHAPGAASRRARREESKGKEKSGPLPIAELRRRELRKVFTDLIAVDEVIDTATLGRVAIYRRWVVDPDGQDVATDFVPKRDEHAFRQHDSLSSAIRQMRMEQVAA